MSLLSCSTDLVLVADDDEPVAAALLTPTLPAPALPVPVELVNNRFKLSMSFLESDNPWHQPQIF